ncbi:hypothetical protein KKA27_03960 [Patescibacteria group bacterium]|nr:hypothetical protein [Patescibacteria group bacterium]
MTILHLLGGLYSVVSLVFGLLFFGLVYFPMTKRKSPVVRTMEIKRAVKKNMFFILSGSLVLGLVVIF